MIKSSAQVQAFKENRAAKKIQHEWLAHKQRGYDEELDDVSQITVFLYQIYQFKCKPLFF